MNNRNRRGPRMRMMLHGVDPPAFGGCFTIHGYPHLAITQKKSDPIFNVPSGAVVV